MNIAISLKLQIFIGSIVIIYFLVKYFYIKKRLPGKYNIAYIYSYRKIVDIFVKIALYLALINIPSLIFVKNIYFVFFIFLATVMGISFVILSLLYQRKESPVKKESNIIFFIGLIIWGLLLWTYFYMINIILELNL